MATKKSEWILAAALLLAVNVLMVPSRAMSLCLHRSYLRNRRTRQRTFGRMEIWLCPVFMIAILTAAVLAQWYQVVYFNNIQQQLMEQIQSGDPLAVFGAMLGTTKSPGVVRADQVYRACRLLLKALCVWIMACGVLGFAGMEEQGTEKQGELYDH